MLILLQIKTKPPNPQRIAVSEYKGAFPNRDYSPNGEIVDLTPKYHCKVCMNGFYYNVSFDYPLITGLDLLGLKL